MTIDDILNLPPEEAVAVLSSVPRSLPEWAELAKAYDPKKHAILDKGKYPDVVTEAGRIEAVTRVVIPFQKLAVSRTAELCFAIPMEKSFEGEHAKHEEAQKLIARLWEALRMDALYLERARQLFASCEIVTMWHAVDKPTRAYGFASPVTLRQRTFSPMLGHRIYPRFDPWGDMEAISVAYRSSGVDYFETLTDKERIVWRMDGKQWQLEIRQSHTLGKIPAVYASRPAPVWEDASSTVEELEWALSRNGNYLRRNAKPLLVVMHDAEASDPDDNSPYGQDSVGSPRYEVGATSYGQTPGSTPSYGGGTTSYGGGAEKDYEGDSNAEFRTIYELPKGSEMRYVTWDGAPEALKFHYQTLRSLFFDSLQLPDWSHSVMKSTPMSGEARKQLYIDAQLKVRDEAGALEVFALREISVLRSFAAILRPDLAEALEEMSVRVRVQPFELGDEKETIQNLSQARAAGLVSQREAIAYLGWTNDPDATLEALREEAALSAGEQTL